MTKILSLIMLCTTLLVAGCAATPPDTTHLSQKNLIDQLDIGIANMGEGVDPAEAATAARIAYEYTAILKQQYQIVDPPLVHNTKVNMGIKPRGLCKDWADDLEARLKQENFQTLSLHRAIANADSAILIEHSTVIISRKGDDMTKGIVLDPWRYGGTLFWARFPDEPKYRWIAREEVFAMKRARNARRGGS